MAYYSVVKQCLTSLRSGAKVLDDLKKQMEEDRETDERFAQRLFYYKTLGVRNSSLKRSAMSPPPTLEQLTQWRLDWYTYQGLRTESRQKIIVWSNQLEGLVNGVRKHVGEDADSKRITLGRIQSKGVRKTTKKASIPSPSISDDEEESSNEEQSSDDEEVSEDVVEFRSLRCRQLLRFLLALRPINTTYYNFAMATIQEYDIDLMVVLYFSRMCDAIKGEEQWPPYWTRSPQLCWWITQDVVEWMDELPGELALEMAEEGIGISESESNITRDLAEDAATYIRIDSGDRLDRFRGPRF